MSIHITEKQLPHSYDGYAIDCDKQKQRLSQKIPSEPSKNDSVEISKAGREALEHKLSALCKRTQDVEIKKLSPVSSLSVLNDFEKAISMKTGEKTTSNTFDGYANQMASAYYLLKNNIEKKYSREDREPEYYVADDGSIQELSREKELEMLDQAYAKHSELMATSTQIWSSLEDFKAQTTDHTASHHAQPEVSYKSMNNSERKNQAHHAFLSTISKENESLLSQSKNGWNPQKLNLSISSSARSELNRIWDYYANLGR